MPAGLRPRWISAATRLVEPSLELASGALSRAGFRTAIPQFVEATDRGRRSFVARMKIETLSVDFTDEQKRYLEGLDGPCDAILGIGITGLLFRLTARN